MIVFTLLIIGCGGNADNINAQEVAEDISLPPGFEMTVFAEDVPNARQLAVSPSGVVFAGSRDEGVVHAVIDQDGDYVADRVVLIAEDLELPTGIAFRNGDLYVACVSTIYRYDNIEENLDNPPEPVVVTDSYPEETWHGWKYLAFGPDDKLYVPVGAPCNVCNREEEIFASITRINPDGTGREIIAHGVRNTVGFDWDPLTGDLWFTDNGRDWMGNNKPPCELNHLTEVGQHFGFPYLHGSEDKDPDWGAQADEFDITLPAQELGPHVAPLGMTFYTGSMFPEEYHNQVFIAEHGSWNRDEKIGYRITLVKLDENREAISYSTFAEGWLLPNEAITGRPVDVVVLEDGSMLVSDDYVGKIYRITYSEDES